MQYNQSHAVHIVLVCASVIQNTSDLTELQCIYVFTVFSLCVSKWEAYIRIVVGV